MELVNKIVLTLTGTSTGLIAGLLYSYSCSVNLGLAKLNNLAYLSAMQNINKAILNPVFFFSFMGALILLPIATWIKFNKPVPLSFWLLLSATVVYFIGVMGITIFGNVPLNDKLASFNLQTASIENLKSMRDQFENSWNTFHTIRTIAAIASFVLVNVAFLNPELK